VDQQIGGILIDADRAGLAQLIGAIAAERVAASMSRMPSLTVHVPWLRE
jgi:hypothetical protein